MDLSSLYQQAIRKPKDSASSFDVPTSKVCARLISGGITLSSMAVELFSVHKIKIVYTKLK